MFQRWIRINFEPLFFLVVKRINFENSLKLLNNNEQFVEGSSSELGSKQIDRILGIKVYRVVASAFHSLANCTAKFKFLHNILLCSTLGET